MAEMSIESKERGPEVAKQCAWLISGIALAYWLDFGFTGMDSQVSWVDHHLPCLRSELTIAPEISHFFPSSLRWYFSRFNAPSS